MHNMQQRIRISRVGMLAGVCFVLFLAWGTSAVAAPMNGRELTLRQPDGSTIKAKAFGDEFYYWLETDDGYVVIQDPKTKAYTYASLSANGDGYESTGIPVGKKLAKLTEKEQKQIQKLQKKLRISRKSRKEKIDLARKAMCRDDEGRIVLPAEPSPSIQYAPTADGATVTNDVPMTSGVSVSGTRRALALLVEFPESPGDVTVSRAEVESYFNDVPYTNNGSATSVREYFLLQSHGQLDLSSTVTDYFVAPTNSSYYFVPQPTLSTRIRELISYRLDQLEAASFDFTQLDGDGDGIVDCVSILYAGGWSNPPGGFAGGLTWTNFASYGLSPNCPMQISPLEDPQLLSVVTHELGHAVCKFPDLYPYDGNAANLGIFGVMAGGNHAGGGKHPAAVSAPMKLQAGWVTATDAPNATLSNHTLDVDGTNIIRYVNPLNSKEYFLFEMRGEVGYEGPYGGSAVEVCPSIGLAIYHVNEDGNNGNSSVFTADNPNCDYSTPMKVLVVENDPVSSITPWYDNPAPGDRDAFGTGDTITDISTPGLAFWSSRGRTVPSGIEVTNILVSTSNLTFSILNKNAPLITASPGVVEVGSNVVLSVESAGAGSFVWSNLSGPGIATLSSTTSTTITASFDTIGSYVMSVTLTLGTNQLSSQATIIVSAGLDEYVGYYNSLPVGNAWHIGWIEFVGNQLQWRNDAGVDWNLLPTAETDVLVTDSTCPYGAGLEVNFSRDNNQVVSFSFNGGTYTRCSPVANNAVITTPMNTPVNVTLTASDVEGSPLTYVTVTSPANGALSGTEPSLTYTPGTNYIGGDALTFIANDGTNDSNIGTITINVLHPDDKPTYRLITLHGDGDGDYEEGAIVSVSADPAPTGKVFTTWFGDVSALTDPESADTTLTMPAAETLLIAMYDYADSSGEYVGFYSQDVIGNGWHHGWIEFSGNQLQWRNVAGASWNLIPGLDPDILETDETCPYPGQNFNFTRVGGEITQFTFNGGTFLRRSPIASNATVMVVINTATNITLTASDPQGNPLSYSVVSQPSYGILSGAEPNMVYTPSNSYVGSDSFTFTASDGTNESNLATINLLIVPTHTANGTPYSWLTTVGITNNHELADITDLDGDGFLTWQEYWSGTDPQDSNSLLRVDEILFDGTNIMLRWQHAQVDSSIPDLVIQSSTNLGAGQWNNVGTNTPANGTNTWMNISTPPIYFRLAAPDVP